MKQEILEKVGWAALEVLTNTLIALAPLAAAAFLVHVDRDASLRLGAHTFLGFVRDGQLFLYAFCALGPVAWLYMANFRTSHVGLRVLFGLLMISVFLVSFSVYSRDPEMKHELASWLAVVSVLMYLACPVLNFFLIILEDEKPPNPDKTFGNEADRLIRSAKGVR